MLLPPLRSAALVSILALVPAGCRSERPPPAAPGAARSPSEVRRLGNHLLGEPSPYLEEHAHNPVDWYPWGEAALERARREGKPIFLSIGYSTCHWCHVMARESFEDDQVAAYLNEHFVSIKVDREQRPDIDALYLGAVAELGASTGWPLTVFLTPALAPYFGGTYFPRLGQGGRPGFVEILREMERLYREEGASVARRGKQVLAELQARGARPAPGEQQPTEAALGSAMQRLGRVRDGEEGGFGGRQKFPNAPLLLAELRYAKRAGEPGAREHLVLTLEHMARGGVHDQLAGGFHRYAVDRRWHVPHFEKTLYDNAQLGALYIEAGLWLARTDLVEVGRAVLDELARGWQRPDGGLVVGFDADDARGEGAYYTWRPAELDAALGLADGRAFAAAFGVTEGGEPDLAGRSVLHRTSDPQALALLGPAAVDLGAVVARARPLLLRERAARPAPRVDDKELAAWNGLALMAFADAARWLAEPRYLEAARRVGSFLLERCLDGPSGAMRRGVRGEARIGEGFLDDQALAGLGLLRLHAADGDARWLEAARSLGSVILARFRDPASGALLRTREQPDPAGAPLRLADDDDGPLPSGGSAATLFLLELGAMTGEGALFEAGQRALTRALDQIDRTPSASGFYLVALDHATSDPREVVIAGEGPGGPLLGAVAKTTSARVLLLRVPAGGAGPALLAGFPALGGKRARAETPLAYVCRHGACAPPTSDPAALAAELGGAR